MKKNKALLLVLGVLLAIAAAVGLYFGVKALNARTDNNPDGSTDSAASAEPTDTQGTDVTGETMELTPEMEAAKAKAVYTEAELKADDPRLDLVVSNCLERSLTNRDAQIYYIMQFVNFMNQYGGYASMLGLDNTQPLSEQPSMVGDLTWEQYFLMAGMQQFQQVTSLAAKADAEGFKVSQEENALLEERLAQMEAEAKTNGFETTDAYIESLFGPGVRMEDYARFLRLDNLCGAFYKDLYRRTMADEMALQEYRDANPGEFEGIEDDSMTVNVRHILFLSDPNEDGTATDEEKANAKARAEELLAAAQANPSEDYFAELAKENSQDPGSKDNGGLYEYVAPGTMVEEFNDWCFDAARQPGDTDIVETPYGYHVMYFVAQIAEWKTTAVNGILNAIIEKLPDNAPLTVNYENIVLSPLPKQEEEAAEEE